MPRSTVPAKVEIFNLSPANNIRLLFAYTGLHEPEQPAPGVYALVVVRHGGTASLFQGQSRRGAVQRLNLALLIYRQNQRVLSGLRYMPTTSSSLAANSGSLMTLKLSTQCGFSP